MRYHSVSFIVVDGWEDVGPCCALSLIFFAGEFQSNKIIQKTESTANMQRIAIMVSPTF